MDRIEHGTGVEPERGLGGSFETAFGLEGRRALVEFLTILVIVVMLAAATSVVLIPS